MKKMGLRPCLCAAELTEVPEEIDLLPRGLVQTVKGSFLVDDESCQLILDQFQEHGVDLVIDYEHQTTKGVQAPAAGWVTGLALTDHSIRGRVRWTDRGREYLKKREYRYLSPVVLVRERDNKAVMLHSAALTNTPAIDGMFPVVNSMVLDDLYKSEGVDEKMEFVKELARLLGLDEAAGEEEVLTAVKAMTTEYTALKEHASDKGELVVNSTLAALLEVPADADTPTVSAKIMALKSPENFVPAEQYRQVADKLAGIECSALVEDALRQGKIAPAQRGWAMDYAQKDRDGFAKFLALSAPAVPMGKVAAAKADRTKTEDRTTARILSNIGVTAEDVKRFGGQEEE